jgi:hypothetical protein
MNTYLQHQSALARYCRTGVPESIPGIHAEHILQYRRLVYNVFDDMLANAFPLTVQLLPADLWKEWVQLFVASHACQSPQVWYMPREFYVFLREQPERWQERYPFLAELLWFEWVEIELFMMEDQPLPVVATRPDTEVRYRLNPEHRLLLLEYPVHRQLAKDITETNRGRYVVLAHRDRSGEVLFTEISLPTAWMMEKIAEADHSFNELLALWEVEWQQPVPPEEQNMLFEFVQESLACDRLFQTN